jgi:hypothetical protein
MIKKIKGSFLKAANLRRYNNEPIRDGDYVGIGKNRHWRINCDNEFELSESNETFDRWALSKRATRLITDELTDVKKFVAMVDELHAEILVHEANEHYWDVDLYLSVLE